MSIYDVFRQLSGEVGVYWKGQFDRVPPVSGVYAWYYPLHLATYDLHEFVNEIHLIQQFDAAFDGKTSVSHQWDMSWRSAGVRLDLTPRSFALPADVEREWEKLRESSPDFEAFRRIVLRSSILAPPLYVGKTQNLHARCSQHIDGSKGSNFHSRFERYAKSVNAKQSRVSDLIFFCLKTDRFDVNFHAESVIEEVLKFTCNPVYSKK